jgi:transposase
MRDRSAQNKKAEAAAWFTTPAKTDVNHRRYETLRAVLVDGLTHAQAAQRFGYTTWAVTNLVRDHKAGALALFAPNARPGPRKGATPARDKARGRAVELRREGLTCQEIAAKLGEEGTPLNRTTVGQVLAEEGFGRLVRGPAPEASASAATPGRDTALPRARVAALAPAGPDRSLHAGLLLLLPDLVSLGFDRAVAEAGYPSTRTIPAANWMLSLLALKLVGARRVSHVDEFLADPAVGLFAGMGALPKKTALTDYSYRTDRGYQARLLGSLARSLAREGLTSGPGVFDLDFHSIMHWGKDPVLEKNYVPTRSQRARSVLTFLAQDHATGTLVYSDADCWKATQAKEAIGFCDHWKKATGADPAVLVMDQKVTTHDQLAALDRRGVAFLTLRMRSAALMAQIGALAPADYKRVALDRPGPHNKPRVHDDAHVNISGYDQEGGVRQLVVQGLGHDTPTVIITNDRKSSARQIITTYAGRMNIEHRLAEIIRAFSADALSSTVNLNADLDLALCVVAQTAVASLARRLPGYQGKTPDTIQRRFLETPGAITVQPDAVTVALDRRAYSPVLRQARLPQDTPIPWWDGRPLRYQLT